MSFKVYVENLNGRVVPSEEGGTIEDVLNQIKDELPYDVFLAKLDNAYRGLTHVITHDSHIEFLDMRNHEAWLVYQNSLTLIFIKAVHDVLGKKVRVTVNNSLNKGVFITLTHKMSQDDINNVLARMQEIVDMNEPIRKEHMTKDQTMRMAKRSKQYEIVNLLENITNIDDIEIYTLLDEREIFYNFMVPSTGYVKKFGLKSYRNGVILRFPNPGDPTQLAPYIEQDLMYDAFSDANRWGQLMGVNFVSDLNERIIFDNTKDLFLWQEALHEKKISEIADMIKDKKSRVVLICGPSSSGKTTFAKRLCIHLGVNGFKTLYLGTDDYYKEKSERTYGPDGEPDLESINAIDVNLFKTQIRDLLDGKEVDIPTYDFNKVGKVFGKRMTTLEKNQLIVIEGIHGMNNLLTDNIEESEKFKIYISPFTPVAIDHHNRISTTDARMLRRLVRDFKFRSYSAQETIKIWPKVRASEDVNIFPYIESADVFFNSNCIYELAVLKKYAEPLLKRVRRTEKEYGDAQRMLNFLKYIDPIYDDDYIASNSIIREFIGGSVIVH